MHERMRGFDNADRRVVTRSDVLAAHERGKTRRALR